MGHTMKKSMERSTFDPRGMLWVQLLNAGRLALRPARIGLSMLLLLLMATVGPLTIWLSIWMNKVAFGKTLQRLRQNIASLEALSGNPD